MTNLTVHQRDIYAGKLPKIWMGTLYGHLLYLASKDKYSGIKYDGQFLFPLKASR